LGQSQYFTFHTMCVRKSNILLVTTNPMEFNEFIAMADLNFIRFVVTNKIFFMRYQFCTTGAFKYYNTRKISDIFMRYAYLSWIFFAHMMLWTLMIRIPCFTLHKFFQTSNVFFCIILMNETNMIIWICIWIPVRKSSYYIGKTLYFGFFHVFPWKIDFFGDIFFRFFFLKR